MSLKEKIIENKKDVSCKNCSYSEILNEDVPYCNKHDKLILPFQFAVKRKCEDFQGGKQ